MMIVDEKEKEKEKENEEGSSLEDEESKAEWERANDYIAVTVQDSGVHVYNINDQKCLKSWSVKPGFKFSQPAIQHPKTEKFYVLQKNKIHCWSIDSDLEKGLSKEISKSLFTLKASIHFPHIVAISKDGQVAILNETLNYVQNFQSVNRTLNKDANKDIFWVHSVDKEKMVHILTCGVENGQFLLDIFTIDPIELTTQHNFTVVFQPSEKDIYPIGCTFDDINHQFILSWSNYVWELFEIPLLEYDLKREFITLTPKRSVPMAGYESTMGDYSKSIKKKSDLFGKSGFVATVVQPSFIAFAGMKQSSNIITVWDVKYGTLQAEQILERNTFEPSQLTDTFRLNLISIKSSSGDYIILADVTSVWACNVNLSTLSLLSVVGKMNETANHLSPAGIKTFVTPPSLVIGNVSNDLESDPAFWQGELEKAEKKEQRTLNLLMSSDKTRTEEQFNQHFFSYVESKKVQLSRIVPAEQSDDEDDDSTLKGQIKDAITIDVSHHFAIQVLSRCFTEPNFFPERVVEFMISTKMVSASETKILRKLIDKKQLNLIEKSLIHIVDIPEPDLVRLIKYFISEVQESDIQDFLDKKQTKNLIFDGDSPKRFFLYLITSAPRNDIFLQGSLKALKAEEVLTLLQFLTEMLQRYSLHHEVNLKAVINTRIPTYAQVLDWVSVVLDSHFTQLVLAKESHAMLKELQTLIAHEVDICDKIESLPGRISHLLNKFNPPAKKPSSYSIEILDI